jgi:hypothetical protein
MGRQTADAYEMGRQECGFEHEARIRGALAGSNDLEPLRDRNH